MHLNISLGRKPQLPKVVEIAPRLDSIGQQPITGNQVSSSEAIATGGLSDVDTQVQSIIQTQSSQKNIFLSSSGHKLFTYNHASRGLLIRVAPEVSIRMSEAFIQDLGKLIEAYCEKAV